MHWPAAVGGESVSVHVHNIDIARSLRNAFVDNFQAFVDEREDQAIDDFIRVNLTALDAESGCLAFDKLQDISITGLSARVRVVALKTCATLLPEPAHLDKLIGYAICAGITALLGG